MAGRVEMPLQEGPETADGYALVSGDWQQAMFPEAWERRQREEDETTEAKAS